jgi:acetylglutamate/LysW-gamma-L-alpha-aminoadipate kinase
MMMTERPILVIKLGGSTDATMQYAYGDIAAHAEQYRIVVVHGVSERMAQLSQQRGIPITMITSPSGHQSRYTPPHIRDLFVEASHGVNTDIVAGLAGQGLMPIAMTSQQAVLHGERKQGVRARIDGRVRVLRDDHTGRIRHVDSERLRRHLGSGQVVVVPPYAQSRAGLLNVDGDRAAASIAGALGALQLLILSNVAGLYRNYPDEQSQVRHVPFTQMESAMNWAQGRMKRKVLGAQQALEAGVRRVTIADGRVYTPIARALSGEGTVFTA